MSKKGESYFHKIRCQVLRVVPLLGALFFKRGKRFAILLIKKKFKRFYKSNLGEMPKYYTIKFTLAA
jgi:hypothetical protein